MANPVKKSPVKLTRVEDAIIIFLLHRVLYEENEVITETLQEIAEIIDRNVKSVLKNIQSLEKKGFITYRKQDNIISVQLNSERIEIASRFSTLTNDRNYTLSNLELLEDMKKIISSLELELEESKNNLVHIKNLNKEIEQKYSQITERELDSLVNSILFERTFSNINKPFERLVFDELLAFRRKISLGSNKETESFEEESESFATFEKEIPPKEESTLFESILNKRMGNFEEEG